MKRTPSIGDLHRAASAALSAHDHMFGQRKTVSIDVVDDDGFSLAGRLSDGSFDPGESGIRVLALS